MKDEREIVLDLETTGFNPYEGHKIVEIGCIELVNKVKTGRVFHSYINPQRDIPQEAFAVHGLSAEFLKDKPTLIEKIDQFVEFIKDAKLIIHNAQFDMKFINYEFEALKLAKIENHLIIDTLLIARKKFPGSPASLNALCKRFNINLDLRVKHGALLDAELLTEVYIQLIGGNQVQFDFSIDNNKDNNIIGRSENFIKEAIKPTRSFSLKKEEEEAHREFMLKIKNPIWQS